MRVTDVEIVSEDSTIIKFSLGRPKPEDRFVAKAIYGLDADELIPKFYGRGDYNESPFYRFGMKPREITMRLVLAPNWSLGESYSDVRDQVYKAISRTRNGELEIVMRAHTTKVASVRGHISKLEVPLFNKDPELQVTFTCLDPFFRSETYFEYGAADFDSTGYISLPDDISTAPHGLEMQFTVTNPISPFSIQSEETNPDWSFTLDPAVNFQLGDKIYISSEYGNKRCEVDDGVDVTGLMDVLSVDSIWPQIFPGNNEFFVPALESPAFVTVDFIRYHAVFWGV